MTSNQLEKVKRFVKSLDIVPVFNNIRVLGLCQECGMPGIELDPFAKHAPDCSKAK